MQVEALIQKAKSKATALSCDDVTFADQPSTMHPNEVEVDGALTRRYTLPTPVLSAAMDTVTEARLALAMAQNGGLGVLHRNLDPDEQARQVQWVRKQVHLGGCIAEPVCFEASERLAAVQRYQRKHQLSFSAFPIVGDGKLVGLLTRNEMAFGNGNPLLSELMRPLAELTTAQAPCTSEEAIALMTKHRIKRLPILDADRRLDSLYVWRDLCSWQEQRASYALDEEGHFLVAAAVSPQASDWERIEKLAAVGCKLIVIDSSHGACQQVVDQVQRIRAEYATMQVIVGNVASYESAKYLLLRAPPDALKVGIGPGKDLADAQVPFAPRVK